MKMLVPVIVVLSLLCFVQVLHSEDKSGQTITVEEAGKKFNSVCLNCHQTPDERVAYGEFWIEMLDKTG